MDTYILSEEIDAEQMLSIGSPQIGLILKLLFLRIPLHDRYETNYLPSIL